MIKYIIKILTIIYSSFLIGCSAISYAELPHVKIKSSLSEICSYNNDKSDVAKKLPNKIGNMELFNVVDFTKKYIGIDMGYGIFYDLKNNKKGSGNIYLYKGIYENVIVNGISDDALREIIAERQDIEKLKNDNPPFSKVFYHKIEFFKMTFNTPPDKLNDIYRCHLLITGYNNIFLKVVFYYPYDSDYSDSETDNFMNDLVYAITLN